MKLEKPIIISAGQNQMRGGNDTDGLNDVVLLTNEDPNMRSYQAEATAVLDVNIKTPQQPFERNREAWSSQRENSSPEPKEEIIESPDDSEVSEHTTRYNLQLERIQEKIRNQNKPTGTERPSTLQRLAALPLFKNFWKQENNTSGTPLTTRSNIGGDFLTQYSTRKAPVPLALRFEDETVISKEQEITIEVEGLAKNEGPRLSLDSQASQSSLAGEAHEIVEIMPGNKAVIKEPDPQLQIMNEKLNGLVIQIQMMMGKLNDIQAGNQAGNQAGSPSDKPNTSLCPIYFTGIERLFGKASSAPSL